MRRPHCFDVSLVPSLTLDLALLVLNLRDLYFLAFKFVVESVEFAEFAESAKSAKSIVE